MTKGAVPLNSTLRLRKLALEITRPAPKPVGIDQLRLQSAKLTLPGIGRSLLPSRRVRGPGSQNLGQPLLRDHLSGTQINGDRANAAATGSEEERAAAMAASLGLRIKGVARAGEGNGPCGPPPERLAFWVCCDRDTDGLLPLLVGDRRCRS